ncbi:alpha/beta-tubulin-N-acetyltransferase 9 isoform X1 [Condylostylus longicornis]|uniref:alpha/beta-tubulin-N-acetyltransferase 9 isoform X1 n=1 Tax=Condylostylus longicornis TaxID=2530218 RepID=UPI00244DC269|nr:alpha/beta-tubulin-N-acetyltransferase 9 isoform X1 [Condylostylus longicornis]
MKLNENVKIIGRKVLLIPYEEKHVEKYHNWMKSAELQILTASEPLSLEEEYAMQKSWRNDEDKCTFLILSKETFDTTNDELKSLIGDTNLFLQYEDDQNEKVAECEIMIAEKEYRRKKLGWESMLLMLKYGQCILNLNKFVAKINENNENSIYMFKKMNFNEISRSEIFHEVTLERKVDETWTTWLDSQVDLQIESYK